MKSFHSGTYVNQGFHKSFTPSFIQRAWSLDNMEVIALLSQADRNLGRLDMYSEYVNIDLFIRMHITKEATQSSKIEGTQTNMEEAFLSKEEISMEKRDDWEEVQNYISAMNEAVKMLHSLPFSTRLIKKTHGILLQGVRGTHKLPGEFRSSQNWIGGATLSDAVFVPPHFSDIAELMSDLEKFANDTEHAIPDLIKIALIHYQFETIHPFLDGNGRVGRLLITLYLVNKGILKQPILYLSDFFERHRMIYYDNLTRVRTHNDINQWLKFFLTGVIETAQKGVQTFDAILRLQKELDLQLKKMGSKGNDAKKVIDFLYTKPIIDAAKVAEIIDKSSVTAYALISKLVELNVLKEITGAKRGRIFVFKDYLDLFNSEI